MIKQVRMNLIRRSALAYRAALIGQNNNFLANEKYIEGIIERRKEANTKFVQNVRFCLILSSIVAYFNLIGGNITFSGFSIGFSKDLVPVVNALVAISFFGTVITFIDDILIQNHINTIGQTANLNPFSFYILDKLGSNLWTDALVPSFFGLKSRRPQIISFKILTTILSPILLLIAAYPLFVSYSTSLEILRANDPQPIAIGAAYFSILLCTASVLLAAYYFYHSPSTQQTLTKRPRSPLPSSVRNFEPRSDSRTMTIHRQKNR